MRDLSLDLGLSRITRFELPICRRLNHLESRALRRLFVLVSRLGDGWLWAAVVATLLVAGGETGAAVVVRLSVVALFGLPTYKLLKHGTARPRPYASGAGIELLAAPLDRFSFPSGHTLHAVGFTVVLAAAYPATAWIALPFTALVAASRVVLGLHYPSDVVAGALLGTLLALAALQL